jgi:hypothetical protein
MPRHQEVSISPALRPGLSSLPYFFTSSMAN